MGKQEVICMCVLANDKHQIEKNLDLLLDVPMPTSSAEQQQAGVIFIHLTCLPMWWSCGFRYTRLLQMPMNSGFPCQPFILWNKSFFCRAFSGRSIQRTRWLSWHPIEKTLSVEPVLNYSTKIFLSYSMGSSEFVDIRHFSCNK